MEEEKRDKMDAKFTLPKVGNILYSRDRIEYCKSCGNSIDKDLCTYGCSKDGGHTDYDKLKVTFEVTRTVIKVETKEEEK